MWRETGEMSTQNWQTLPAMTESLGFAEWLSSEVDRAHSKTIRFLLRPDGMGRGGMGDSDRRQRRATVTARGAQRSSRGGAGANTIRLQLSGTQAQADAHAHGLGRAVERRMVGLTLADRLTGWMLAWCLSTIRNQQERSMSGDGSWGVQTPDGIKAAEVALPPCPVLLCSTAGAARGLGGCCVSS